MKAVKRGQDGQITHILVGSQMMAKEDAHKVLYNDVSGPQVIAFVKKKYGSKGKLDSADALSLIMDILNEKESIIELKKKMMGF
ncbi:MAG TPA: hypothetical protein VMX17_08140 [Candidatus Glassbacteria bacterium]|jgi:ribosome biogenesis protein Tsr3|nr:hypothetical protein [Candidatus Glassbacteria bacterium]